MRSDLTRLARAALCLFIVWPTASFAASGDADVEAIVSRKIRPLMEQYKIPGMAVGIVTAAGDRVLNFGVASRTTGAPVSNETLFEIGSISKTFTATLASYAQVEGELSLSDSVDRFVPELRGSDFGRVSLLSLGTHTPGGMPLQVPDAVADDRQLTAYLRDWKPAYAQGTYRTYANPSIGMLGVAAARAMNGEFAALMKGKLFSPLGLKHTYLDVPAAETANYAQGYAKNDEPKRMTPGVLGSEAYGVRTTAGDMARFVEANMGMLDLGRDLQRAIIDTHAGYYRVGAMTQGLIWERYAYPADLDALLAGNSAKVAFEPNKVAAIDPPLSPQGDVLINKTGSTNGFGAYVAFAPERKLGVVLLANKNYPNDARVRAAHAILAELDRSASKE